jgi:hypothetical protein
MLNDIFATSMHGRYSTTEAGRIVEQGEWSYRGFGNAEITITASAERPDDALRFELRLHSAERQLDDVELRALEGEVPTRTLHAKIAGHVMTLESANGDGDESLGNLSVPPETVFDGPSPIWLIHLVMTAPPPTDRVVTTPVVRFMLEGGGAPGIFYRFTRDANRIAIAVLDDQGVETSSMSLRLDEDGCPRHIASGATETEILRLPSA